MFCNDNTAILLSRGRGKTMVMLSANGHCSKVMLLVKIRSGGDLKLLGAQSLVENFGFLLK